jgi:hypothetical protein
MSSKRAKSNRGRFFGKRRVKPVRPKAGEEIHVIDPRASRDEAWRLIEVMRLGNQDDFKESSAA